MFNRLQHPIIVMILFTRRFFLFVYDIFSVKKIRTPLVRDDCWRSILSGGYIEMINFSVFLVFTEKSRRNVGKPNEIYAKRISVIFDFVPIPLKVIVETCDFHFGFAIITQRLHVVKTLQVFLSNLQSIEVLFSLPIGFTRIKCIRPSKNGREFQTNKQSTVAIAQPMVSYDEVRLVFSRTGRSFVIFSIFRIPNYNFLAVSRFRN